MLTIPTTTTTTTTASGFPTENVLVKVVGWTHEPLEVHMSAMYTVLVLFFWTQLRRQACVA